VKQENCSDARQSPPREEGWTRHQEKCREATLVGADGVVAHTETWVASDHPGCAASVASQHFITGAATPPHEEGINAHDPNEVPCEIYDG
jgi:hypothetical protein